MFHFRKSIDLPDKPEHFIVNISADNRYRLLVNGQLASSGPARGDPAHWRYETADLAPYLHPGRNVLAALVWNWGDYRPTAQMTLRTGFLRSVDAHESRSAEGLTTSRYPSDPAQYIPPFSLWWVAMVHDYWMLRDDPAFVQRLLPGIRGVLDWYEGHLDATGMLGPMPWWNFLDWTDAFERGVPPGADDGHSTAITLQYVYALHLAGEMEAALGSPETGARNRATAERLIATVRERTWNGERNLFSDSLESQSFSQQTNTLAVLTGAARDRRAVTVQLLKDPRIVQASYYFRFYVDEAMHAAGVADGYLTRLESRRTS